MKNQSRIIHFNSKEIEESNGIYGLIVKTVMEQKGIGLEELKPLFMNRVPGAKISNWNSFKNTLVRVLERGGDMSFSSFLNWSRLLNIKTAVTAISFYGEDFEEDFVLDKDYDENNKVINKDTFKNIAESAFKDLEELVEDDLEEEAGKVKDFLEYLLPLLSYQITPEQDEREVCKLLQDKITEGFKFLNLQYKSSLSVTSGELDENTKFFVVVVMIEDRLVTSTIVKVK